MTSSHAIIMKTPIVITEHTEREHFRAEGPVDLRVLSGKSLTINRLTLGPWDFEVTLGEGARLFVDKVTGPLDRFVRIVRINGGPADYIPTTREVVGKPKPCGWFRSPWEAAKLLWRAVVDRRP